jgi:aryl-alcohol dehydrogenase-like predicted oxidoreductase
LRALDDLVRRGYVRYVGVSNWAAWHIAKALGISRDLGLTRIDSLQAYYSVAGRDLERELIPMMESEGVGLLVWSPLAGGLLTGKQARGSQPPEGSRRSAVALPPVDFDRTFNAIDVMRPIAEARGASIAQIALAWLLHKKAVSSVIIGAKRPDQLEDNLKASSVVLSDEEVSAINAVSELPGEYPGWMFGFWSEVRRSQLANSKR